jgi:nitrous oxidase accessory protein NosD
VIDAMKKAEAAKADRYVRQMLPGAHSVDERVGYILLILAHHSEAPGDAYTEYRKRRVVLLHGYCLNMLRENRTLKRAVGIDIDASSKVTGCKGGSEDFYALEVEVRHVAGRAAHANGVGSYRAAGNPNLSAIIYWSAGTPAVRPGARSQTRSRSSSRLVP